MRPKENKPTVFGNTAQALGALMMWAWTLVIGIFGFVLLLGVYHAMVVQSQSLLTICCFFLALPVLLTVVFGCLRLAELTVHGLALSRTSDELVKVASGEDV